jgi:subtilase family serine protease
MDIDQIVSLAPRAHVIVYDGPNSTDSSSDAILNRIVSDDRAEVISDSWGECEPEDGRGAANVDDVLLQEAAVQGQTFVVAAGDDGAQDCYFPKSDDNRRLEVDEPASDPWATGVGGTLLSQISPFTERAWNNRLTGTLKELGKSGAGAGGGGLSHYWKMPIYQRDASPSLRVIQPDSTVGRCAPVSYCREVPDVSASADPAFGYMTYWNGPSKKFGGWQSAGGTSDAAPLWAALFALADAQPGCSQTDVGFANPLLYELAAEPHAEYFHDARTGNNDFLDTSGSLFPARPGYDMATGLGSPDAAALAPALCDAEPRLTAVSNQSLTVGQQISIQLQAALPGRAGTGRPTTTGTITTTVPAVTTTTPAGTTTSPTTATVGVTTTTLAGATIPGTSLLIYRQSGLPPGVRLDSITGLISGAPTTPGTYRVSFWVTTPNGAISREVSARWVIAA